MIGGCLKTNNLAVPATGADLKALVCLPTNLAQITATFGCVVKGITPAMPPIDVVGLALEAKCVATNIMG